MAILQNYTSGFPSFNAICHSCQNFDLELTFKGVDLLADEIDAPLKCKAFPDRK